MILFHIHIYFYAQLIFQFPRELIEGPIVLQIDEWANIGSSKDDQARSESPNYKRMLKMALTDGSRAVRNSILYT